MFWHNFFKYKLLHIGYQWSYVIFNLYVFNLYHYIADSQLSEIVLVHHLLIKLSWQHFNWLPVYWNFVIKKEIFKNLSFVNCEIKSQWVENKPHDIKMCKFTIHPIHSFYYKCMDIKIRCCMIKSTSFLQVYVFICSIESKTFNN